MSTSAWPPSLKAFVARSLAAATTENKTKVNEEMRKIIFTAYSSGTMQSMNWDGMDPFETLESLKLQKLRTTHTTPVAIALPKAFGTTKNKAGAGVDLNSFQGEASTSTQGQKRKKGNNAQGGGKKNANGTALAFPSAYTFASNPSEEDEARAKRAKRFEREAAIEQQRAQAGPRFVPRQLDSAGGDVDMEHHHHPNAVEVTDENTRKISLGQMGVQASGGRRKWLGSRLGLEDLAEPDPNVIDWDKHTIVGTSQRLEKPYLRLTSEPDPATVRPLPVLKQTLAFLKRKWKEKEDYPYICDQFKSLRQDLTVQRIKNEFTVSVYECFARMALQEGDLGEYNQCQSMLKQLYERDIPGRPEEFLAYRILYLLHTQNRAELSRTIGNLTPAEKAQPVVKQALQITTALATGNYHRFFKLFLTVDNMGGYIVDAFAARERMLALTTMSKAYNTLPLPFVAEELAFDDAEQCHLFLDAHQAATYTNPTSKPDPQAQRNGSYAGAARKHLGLAAPTPFAERVWDCKAAHAACEQGNHRYRKVDIKGQK